MEKHSSEFVADTVRSTFFWIINLDNSHVLNSPTAKPIHGYSKADGHDERQNKNELLIRKIEMVCKRGYHERCTADGILFFAKRGELLNKENSTHLLTLFAKSYTLENPMMLPKYDDIRDYLRRLYACINAGEDFRYLLPKKHKPNFSKDDWFDITKFNFRNQEQLDNYCSKRIKDNHPIDKVFKFRTEYMEKRKFYKP